MYIQSNVQYLRRVHGLTYNALAIKSGVGFMKIQRIETGATKDPQIRDMNELAKYFKVSLDDFVNQDFVNQDLENLTGGCQPPTKA